MKTNRFLILIFLLTLYSCNQQSDLIKYLGQKIPTVNPEIFGEGIISVDSTGEGTLSFTADGLEVYFVRYFKDKNGETNGVRSLFSRYNGKIWTDLKDKDREIFYKTPQFVNDTLAIMASKGVIWKSIKKNDSTWSNPVFIDSLDLSWSNGVTDWSITNDLEIFYVKNGEIETTKIIDNKIFPGNKINGFKDFRTRHVGVSPKGDYLLCDGFLEGVNNGWADNYISFKKSESEWTFPIHLDSTINTKNQTNYLPRISPDGEAFFFSRQDSTNYGDIYWISTKGLEKYKNGL